MRPSSAGRALVVAACCAAGVLGPAPGASGHGTDPTLVPVLEAIAPALPAGVIVQVRTGVSEQMVVANPTARELAVLDPDGTAFLRVSRDGVFGNVAEPFFHQTLNPPDVPARVPPTARDGAKARWIRLSDTDAFGWFEPRLHPAAPGTEAQTSVVSRWTVDMRLASEPVRVTGTLERRAVTGAFSAQAEPAGDGLQVSVAQGRVPALLLVAPPDREVIVVGSDGVDFLRLDSDGAFANSASASFGHNPDFGDRAARGEEWVRVGEPGRVRWLDPRLQYALDRPPEVVERAAQPAELGRWEIPLRLDGTAAALRGTISWLPAGVLASGATDSGPPWAALGAEGAFVTAIGAVAIVARRRARGAARSES